MTFASSRLGSMICLPYHLTIVAVALLLKNTKYLNPGTTILQLYEEFSYQLSVIWKLCDQHRPGRKAGEPTVHHLRALEYSTAGDISYKLGFSDEHAFEKLPHRMNIPLELFEWVQVFMNLRPISLRKFNDPQSMKQVIPADAHHYYDTLPHLDN